MSVGIRFTETMRGHVSTTVLDDYARAEADGKRMGTPLEFTVAVGSDNLDEMLSNAAHQGRIDGEIRCPALWPSPLKVSNGTFNLLTTDPAHVNARQSECSSGPGTRESPHVTADRIHYLCRVR